jgi:hypothetical protein
MESADYNEEFLIFWLIFKPQEIAPFPNADIQSARGE